MVLSKVFHPLWMKMWFDARPESTPARRTASAPFGAPSSLILPTTNCNRALREDGRMQARRNVCGAQGRGFNSSQWRWFLGAIFFISPIPGIMYEYMYLYVPIVSWLIVLCMFHVWDVHVHSKVHVQAALNGVLWRFHFRNLAHGGHNKKNSLPKKYLLIFRVHLIKCNANLTKAS